MAASKDLKERKKSADEFSLMNLLRQAFYTWGDRWGASSACTDFVQTA
jgi:hypothetical protein